MSFDDATTTCRSRIRSGLSRQSYWLMLASLAITGVLALWPAQDAHAQATEARWWPYINLYLVTWGQNVCKPVYPRCATCAIKPWCRRIGVTRVSRS